VPRGIFRALCAFRLTYHEAVKSTTTSFVLDSSMSAFQSAMFSMKRTMIGEIIDLLLFVVVCCRCGCGCLRCDFYDSKCESEKQTTETLSEVWWGVLFPQPPIVFVQPA
jgi:hypothetical protein